MHTLSGRSKKEYDTLHEDLQKIIDLALEVSLVDFIIVEGHRNKSRQKKLFEEGKSKIDGINTVGKHNYLPSFAFDFCAYIPGKPKLAYDEKHIMYLVGVFTACAKFLLINNHISHDIRSGSNWDNDGELIYDQKFNDSVHLELIIPNK